MSSSSQAPTDTVAAHRRGRSGCSRTLIAAAVAALLAQPPAMALSLGSLEMASHLGEPLRAEIPLGIGPGERVSPDCIRLSTDATAGARAAPHYEAQLRLLGTTANPRLVINGRTPLNEPIMDLIVTVRCPGAPIMERGYLLMLTPAAVAETRAAQATPSAPASRPASAASGQDARQSTGASAITASTGASPPAQRSARGSATAAPALASGQTYRVAPGDTLSTIAQRVTDRQTTLWNQAEAIFAANPAAFISGDRNRIRAGALIDIPAGAVGSALAAGAAANPSAAANHPGTLLARDAAPDTPPRRTVATPSTAAVTASIAATIAPSVADPLSAETASTAASASASASVAITANSAIAVTAAGSAQRQPVGPPLPQRAIRPDIDAQPASTSPVVESTPDNVAPGAGVLRWLASLVVGLGFISLAALLAWTAMRRRPEDAEFDAQATGRATHLAPAPSFDPALQQTGRFKSGAHGLQDADATDEVRVLEDVAIAAPAAIYLDDLFPPEPGGLPEAAVQPVVPDATLNLEATGRFEAPPPRTHAGDTTVEHQFQGFSETQALEQQMAEAMTMLERDYTSRFEAASLEDNPSLDVTDTLHNLSAELTLSLEHLRLSAEDGAAHSAVTAEAGFAEEPTALLPAHLQADPAVPADDLFGELTALLDQPAKVSNG
jgi:pilus assembly protein FimV